MIKDAIIKGGRLFVLKSVKHKTCSKHCALYLECNGQSAPCELFENASHHAFTEIQQCSRQEFEEDLDQLMRKTMQDLVSFTARYSQIQTKRQFGIDLSSDEIDFLVKNCRYDNQV